MSGELTNPEQSAAPQTTEKGLDEAANVRYLKADEFVLLRGEGGGLRLTLTGERTVLRVKTRRCFPLGAPGRFISVRDGSDQEIGIIPDLMDLPPEWRSWIEDDLSMRYFMPVVKSIVSLKQRWGGLEWRLETDRGGRKVITKRIHDCVSEVDQGRYLMTDVDGNRYELRLDALDAASRLKLDKLL